MITNIDLTRMRNDEFIQFMVNVAEIANLQDTTALLIKSQTDALQLQAQALDEVFKKQQGGNLTHQERSLYSEKLSKSGRSISNKEPLRFSSSNPNHFSFTM